MKTAIVYNPKDHKLIPESYSQTFRNMILALIKELKPQHITKSCSVKDIDADAIIFFDPHSTHVIKIDGVVESSKLKYEFMDDPHQIEMFGRHGTTGITFQKLGAGGRIKRALNRGIDYIICPHKTTYYRYFSPYLDGRAEKMLVWFPCAPSLKYFVNRNTPLVDRKHEVLANGATWAFPTFYPYRLRSWGFAQPEIEFVPHYIRNKDVPHGISYPAFLGRYAGALALCEDQLCPKHLEIPLAGCLCFAQELDEYRELGFKDGINCVLINKKNFSKTITDFKNHVQDYQHIASTGKSLVENNYTAAYFADFIRGHIEQRLNSKKILSPGGRTL